MHLSVFLCQKILTSIYTNEGMKFVFLHFSQKAISKRMSRSSVSLLLLLLLLATAFAPVFMSPPGIEEAVPMAKFLNGNLPAISPADGSPLRYGVSPAFPNLRFNSPLVIEMHPLADTMFVAQRDGLIEYFRHDPSVQSKSTFLDLRSRTALVWDGGFLGLAFHPEFGKVSSANRNYFYTFYCAKGSSGEEGPMNAIPFTCEQNPVYEGSYMILSRFEVEDNSLHAIPESEQIMLKLRLYNSSHRGGGLTFGNDGMLYLALGEQGRYTTSQNIHSNFEGGCIRIDVNKNEHTSHPPIRKMGLQVGKPDELSGLGYYIPNNNPWQDSSGSIFEEFWTIGHRNPHRLSLDKSTGQLWVGEVGSGFREEINLLTAGENYGWPIYEGHLLREVTACGSDSMPMGRGTYGPPVMDFMRDESNCIIGGYVYRGSSIPSLKGKYICGGYSQNRLFAIQDTGGDYSKTEIGTFSPGALITFGMDHEGELYAGKEGNYTTLYRLTSSPAAPPAPRYLSMTGAFADLKTLTPAEGVIPYEVNAAFWSDGADKYRWMAIPNDEDGNGIHDKPYEKIAISEDGEWDFPVGSVLIKHFELGRKRLETRFEVRGNDGTYYYLTYKWNEVGTDAELLDHELDELVEVDGKSQIWHYPSRSACQGCHTEAAGSVLGTKTAQLNRSFAYPSTGVSANQLITLSHLDMLDRRILDTDTALLPHLVSHDDPDGSLEDRVRSYLDANCAYCHRPGTGNRATFDARYQTPLPLQNLIDGSVIDPLGLENTRLVVPKDTGRSILYQRVKAQGMTAMPPIGKNLLDKRGLKMIAEWINSLSPINDRPLAIAGDANRLSGGCYELTADATNQAGAAWYPLPINLKEDMTASFNLSFGNRDRGADGIAFLFHQLGTDIVGGHGTGQGVSGMAPSIGISFDTYGQTNDEIFMFKNGSVDAVIAPRVCATADCQDIEDGGSYAVSIYWKADMQTLDVYFAGELRQRFTGDIIQTYFGDNPWVYLGLGAGTGGATSQQLLCNFNLQASFPPSTQQPNQDGSQWLDFRARQVDSRVQLHWGTRQEQNNQLFVVERSSNGQDFEDLAVLFSQGNSLEPQYYGYTDKSPIQGKQFYRIRKVDQAGQTAHSPKIEITIQKDLDQINIYPNPVKIGQPIYFDMPPYLAGSTSISLFDLNGRRVFHSNADIQAGTHPILPQKMTEGIFILRLAGNNWKDEQRILIVR